MRTRTVAGLIGLVVLLLAIQVPMSHVYAASAAPSMKDLWEKLVEIEGKLWAWENSVNNKLVAIQTWLTTDSNVVQDDELAAAEDAVLARLGDPSGFRASWTSLSFALDDIKTEVEDIYERVNTISLNLVSALEYLSTTIYPAVDEVEGYVDEVESRLGTDATGPSTVMGKLEDITSRLAALSSHLPESRANNLDDVAQAFSDVGETGFTSGGGEQLSTIYESEAVGTVTVTIHTIGIGTGEQLTIHYYLDPDNPSNMASKEVTTNANTPCWTDTVAAWKVVLWYWSSTSDGTDTVSAIRPPT